MADWPNMTGVPCRISLAALALVCGSATALFGTPATLSRSPRDVNTLGYEDSPFLSADGQALYFMYTPWSVWPTFHGGVPALVGPLRALHHDNPDGNPWEDSDVYASYKQADGTWGVPQNLGFNDQQADCCAMTWNHVEFFYQRTQFPNSALTDLHTVTRQPDGSWRRQSLGSLINEPGASEQNPHVTADGRELYFTSDRSGGAGGTDLYMSSRLADGSWSTPVLLPPSINTSANEDQAWLSPDGATLYFNREPGPRIMAARRTVGGWSAATPVAFGGLYPDAAEVSGTADGTQLAFAIVRPDLEDIVIVTSERQQDGSWGAPAQVDFSIRVMAPGHLRVAP